jgi:hypothetical protein
VRPGGTGDDLDRLQRHLRQDHDGLHDGCPRGMFTAFNGCSDGAPSLLTSATGLRTVDHCQSYERIAAAINADPDPLRVQERRGRRPRRQAVLGVGGVASQAMIAVKADAATGQAAQADRLVAGLTRNRVFAGQALHAQSSLTRRRNEHSRCRL